MHCIDFFLRYESGITLSAEVQANIIEVVLQWCDDNGMIASNGFAASHVAIEANATGNGLRVQQHPAVSLTSQSGPIQITLVQRFRRFLSSPKFITVAAQCSSRIVSSSARKCGLQA